MPEILNVMVALMITALWLMAWPYMPTFITEQLKTIITALILIADIAYMAGIAILRRGNWG